MKRTIEKLTHDRESKEKKFREALKSFKEKNNNFLSDIETADRNLASQLETLRQKAAPGHTKKDRKFSLRQASKETSYEKTESQAFLSLLDDCRKELKNNWLRLQKMFTSFLELVELQSAMTDAKDKEWDILGSNHVAMIFKSMEWRVDQLSVEYADVKILMKKFIQLRKQLTRLLTLLEGKKMPSPSLVKELQNPIEDNLYTGFENRFRGHEEQIKDQQRDYLQYFQKGPLVLDLGCGRGEFLEMLEETGVPAQGIDINEQMIDICRDKGLNSRKKDILEALAECRDNSLSGIFSSQVIEHLHPGQLKKFIELAFDKLMPQSRIVLETINPTSVFSLVQTFFLDMTHQKPVHPQALKFLLESSGFEEAEIVYSSTPEEEQLKTLPVGNETAEIINSNIDKLNRLLYAPSNYAVIGLKK
ncbi:MAG: class I SAM-dependent methyltransferase [Candidatus Aminicenantes bacterium]|nr:class I SAM-dependent methyltransferase [Candidatus Aminicenantes bacterium]